MWRGHWAKKSVLGPGINRELAGKSKGYREVATLQGRKILKYVLALNVTKKLSSNSAVVIVMDEGKAKVETCRIAL